MRGLSEDMFYRAAGIVSCGQQRPELFKMGGNKYRSGEWSTTGLEGHLH